MLTQEQKDKFKEFLIERLGPLGHGNDIIVDHVDRYYSTPGASSTGQRASTDVRGVDESDAIYREAGEYADEQNYLDGMGIEQMIISAYVAGACRTPTVNKEGMEWVQASERLPDERVDEKMKPVLVRYLKYTDKIYHTVAYYFPDRFKTIEWEDWDDYDEADFPYTENDKESGTVWLRAGFYTTIECDKCEGYWSAPLKVLKWIPIPGESLPTSASQPTDIVSKLAEANPYMTGNSPATYTGHRVWNEAVATLRTILGDKGKYNECAICGRHKNHCVC